MQENYEAVQKGMRILLPLMARYIGKEMNGVYHSNWWEEVLSALSEQRDLPYEGSDDKLIDSLDFANCLRLIDRKWNDVFRFNLDFNVRTWAKELMGVRNSVAHIGQQDMSQADAERALDTMIRVCDTFDSEGAAKIRELYHKVRFYSDANSSNKGAEHPSPIDIPASTTLGYAIDKKPLLNLLKLINTDVVQKTTLTRKVTFAGKTAAYPVYKVRLDVLYYNDQNDRIATWISRYKAEHGADALEKLSATEYNTIIEKFIYESNPEAIQKTQKNISIVGQREPGVTLADGRIVDGNRRYTCLRRIQRDSSEVLYFETVIMDVDIQKDKKQIKLLELAMQHGEEKKVDYDLIDYAIGTYLDIAKTKLVTIEEYANSTNESITEVKKRIDIAEVINEFLDYIGLPEQYHIAREYQIYSIFQEMMPTLKQLSGDERKQLKTIVFNNVILRALLDQRKFIRDIKLLIKMDTHLMYFEDQEHLNELLHRKYDNYVIRSKSDIEDFARQNEELTEELQMSLQRALLRSRRQHFMSKPLENVAKSVSLIKEFDTRTFEKMDAEEKGSLKKEMDQLSAVVEQYSAILTHGEVRHQEPSQREEFNPPKNQTTILHTTKEQLVSKGRPSLAKCSQLMPLLICQNAGKKITTFSFSLTFNLIKESDYQIDSANYTLVFVDSDYNEVSNASQLSIHINETAKCNFVLSGNMGDRKEVYLLIKPDEATENEAIRIIPFEMNVTFSADFGM